MTLKHLILSVFVFLSLAAEVSAETQDKKPASDAYSDAMVCFERLDYQCAIELFPAALLETAQTPQKTRIIYNRMAESHLALGQWKMAVSAFVRLLEKQPDFEIISVGTSPKIIEALAEARRQLQDRAFQKTIPPVPATKSKEIPQKGYASLSTGVELLAGNERACAGVFTAFQQAREPCIWPAVGFMEVCYGLWILFSWFFWEA